MCHPKLHLLKKDSCDHYNGQLRMKYFKRPQTLGSGHRFFSAFKNSIGSDLKSQPSKATISEPSFLNLGTLDSQIIVIGIFFAKKSYMGEHYHSEVFSRPERLSSRRLRPSKWQAHLMPDNSCLRSQRSDHFLLVCFVRYSILMKVHFVPSKATPIEKGLL